MGTHWGVDSRTRSDHLVHGKTFFDHLTARAGRQPEFWGRYLNNYSYGLTRKEKDFLLKRNCRVLLVYNGKERKQPYMRDPEVKLTLARTPNVDAVSKV